MVFMVFIVLRMNTMMAHGRQGNPGRSANLAYVIDLYTLCS